MEPEIRQIRFSDIPSFRIFDRGCGRPLGWTLAAPIEQTTPAECSAGACRSRLPDSWFYFLIGAGVVVAAGAVGAGAAVFDVVAGFVSTGFATAGVVAFGASTCFATGAAGWVGFAAFTGSAGFAAGAAGVAVVGVVTGLAASMGFAGAVAGAAPCANAEPETATESATAARSFLDICLIIPVIAAMEWRLAARRDAFMRHCG